MKPTPLTLKRIGAVWLASLALTAVSLPVLAQENAFKEDDAETEVVLPEYQEVNSFEDGIARNEGVMNVQLTPSQVDAISKYAGASRFRLAMALKDTLAASPNDALPKLTMEICDIVVGSRHVARGSELLFRMVLRQGLELVYGDPTDNTCLHVNPKADLDPALLGPGASLRLAEQMKVFHYQILRDTADFALSLAETENQVFGRIQGVPVGMLDLPYPQFAYYKVMAAHIWNQTATFLGARMEYAHLRATFRQWIKVVATKKHREYTKYSAMLARTLKVLADTQLLPGESAEKMPYYQMVRKTRRLRRHLTELLTELKPKFIVPRERKGDFNPVRVVEITKDFADHFAAKDAPAAGQ